MNRSHDVFRGFTAKAFGFLEVLAETQSRDWFQAHKDDFERECKRPLAALVLRLGAALAANGIALAGDPDRAIFRIHRDTRFGPDKRPYKTHVSAALTRDGDKSSAGVLYIHIDPAGCFVACGFFRPAPAVLAAIRTRMVKRPADILSVVGALNEAGLMLDRDDVLLRAPRGFEGASHPEIADLLRLKSLVVRRPLARALCVDGDRLTEAIVSFALTSHPLLQFGWAGL
jgi:uncharacterized protein (TIGR02453 family)